MRTIATHVLLVLGFFGVVGLNLLAEGPTTHRSETYSEWLARQGPGTTSQPSSLPSTQPTSQPASRPTQVTRSIEGLWREAPKVFVIVSQTNDTWKAQCSYTDDAAGLVQWEMKGTVTPDGKIRGTLQHTKAPANWSKMQTREAKLSDDGNTISGTAKWPGGKGDFTWTRKILVTKYDEFQDRTTVSTPPMAVSTTKAEFGLSELQVGASCSFKGKDRPKNSLEFNLFILFISSSDNAVSAFGDELILLIDGARFKSPVAAGREAKVLTLDPSTLQKFLDAKEVKGQIGITEFRMDQAQIAAFAELYKTTHPK